LLPPLPPLLLLAVGVPFPQTEQQIPDQIGEKARRAQTDNLDHLVGGGGGGLVVMVEGGVGGVALSPSNLRRSLELNKLD